jgi:phosphopantetheinyl transferase
VIQRPGPDLEPAHVWLAPAGDDPRTTAHELLLTLGRTLLTQEPVLRHDDLGKPHLDPLSVSVSHGHDLVAVAAGPHGPIGVDLEQRRSFDVSGLANRWFDPAELAWMREQSDEVEAFLHLWTAKEAVGKALGRGLRKSGLRRLMPLPGERAGDNLVAKPVPAEPELSVVWLPVTTAAVVALVVPAGTKTVELVEHHGAALRRTVRSRTSFPVVVRGN